MIKEEEYLKAKQIIQEYEEQLNISDVSNSCSCNKPVCNISGMIFCSCCNRKIPEIKLKIAKNGLVLGLLEDNCC